MTTALNLRSSPSPLMDAMEARDAIDGIKVAI